MVTATELMNAYSERGPRYLWTDAFAVCNLLGAGQLAEARDLVERVHETLGRHRTDDARRGWISGLSDADGEAHPTRGGLRIGKPLPERSPGEPPDDHLEWERDGQYFHYLTKWMHALSRMHAATRDDRYLAWARELAETAHDRFVHGARMYWKMSIDLSRPQVASMGQHDPLDGYVTSLELDLPTVASSYRALIEPRALATTDLLGIGGLLVDAHRLVELDADRALRSALLDTAQLAIRRVADASDLRGPAEHRLAFRELGLAIGLAAHPALSPRLREAIQTFWQGDANRRSHTYLEHRDINDVMLATSLAPDGFLATR